MSSKKHALYHPAANKAELPTSVLASVPLAMPMPAPVHDPRLESSDLGQLLMNENMNAGINAHVTPPGVASMYTM